jgi:hypothetical protein
MACRQVLAISQELEARFWAKVARAGPDDCWEWRGMRREAGYGRMKIGGVRWTATHISLLIAGYPRPSDFLALHSCDNPPCVNPAHLRWGTPADNSADAVSRDRMSREGGARGERNPGSVLVEEQVRAIRASELGYKALARRYGVDRTTIRAIKRGKSWRHVA